MAASGSVDPAQSATPNRMPGHRRVTFTTSDLNLPSTHWISDTFEKRVCAYFIPSDKDPDKCGCGQWRSHHHAYAFHRVPEDSTRHPRNARWIISKHTVAQPTDAFGTVEFQGDVHAYKSQYVRLAVDSDPADVMELFQDVWHVPPPKLIITVHGGISNFDLQANLSRVFRKGLIKAAATTGAWIITSGINAGVAKHVAAALDSAVNIMGQDRKVRITCIGITPWGLLKKPDDFLGENRVVRYHPHSFSSRGRILNNRHAYYLFVDDGTVGKYGADLVLRRRLESYIVKKQKIDQSERSVPVVCVLLEGGTGSVKVVLDYVSHSPKVPVVICDGSGRASDLLAFAHECITTEGGQIPAAVQTQMLEVIKKVFNCDDDRSKHLLADILACVRERQLITVFRLGENPKNDVDHAILNALLKGHELSPSEQLALALAWNRVDIAHDSVFGSSVHEVPLSVLHDAMMDALIHDRVDFVGLLLEHGVSMYKFLTIERLEALYNTEHGPPNTLYYIVKDVVRITANYRYTLPHIGLAIEKLMESGYRSYYTSSEFKKIHDEYRKHNLNKSMAHSGAGYLFGPLSAIFAGITPNEESNVVLSQASSGNRALSSHLMWRSALRRENPMTPTVASLKDVSIIDMDDDGSDDADDHEEYHFQYPFSDLLVWAVLTKRHSMARCLWAHGADALAKALVACRLYKSLSKEAAEDYLEVEICDELRQYADEFRQLSLDVLDCCYKAHDTQTLQLLTYELERWGKETCLALAVMANNKAFLAHPCCQILLADLWHGGLRIRTNSNFKVIAGILCPVSVLFFQFKSQDELEKQPQTAGELELNDSDSPTDSENDFSEFEDELYKRRNTGGSNTSRLSRIFQSQRARRSSTIHPFELHNGQPSELKIQEPVVSMDPMPKGGIRGSKKRKHRSQTILHHINSNGNLVGPVASDATLDPSAKAKRLPNTIMGSRKLKLQRRFHEFYAAPITTFWAWTLSYAVFLCVFTYVLLVRTQPSPTAPEWFVFSYVLTMFAESIRRTLMAEPTRLSEKCAFFFGRHWNMFTTVAILSFLTGFGFRVFDDDLTIGRCILAVSSVLWTIKLLDFLCVHPEFGPLVTMAGKMIVNMTYVLIMIGISLLSFGLARQSITYPNEEFHWILVRNIFYKPYFMLYGEVYAPEIDQCGDYLWDAHLENGTYTDAYDGEIAEYCMPGHWIPPLLMTVFLIIADLLLISMLLAIFNNVFDATSRISQQIWLFQRYFQVMEYEATPFLPPPFTLLYHAYMLVKYARHWFLIRSGSRSPDHRSPFDFSLKLFLQPDQVQKVHNFEEECVDEFLRFKEYAKMKSNEEKLKRIGDQTGAVLSKMNDVTARDNKFQASIEYLESKIEDLQNQQSEVLECLRQLMAQKQIPSAPTQLEPLSAIRPRTATVIGGEFGKLQLDHSPSSASLRSLKKALVPTSSLRRQRINDQYTSITDSIEAGSEMQLAEEDTVRDTEIPNFEIENADAEDNIYE